MELNKYQKYNLDAREKLLNDKFNFERGIPKFNELVGQDLVGHFVCTKCGKFPLSSRIIEFYRWNITKCLCYSCQKLQTKQ